LITRLSGPCHYPTSMRCFFGEIYNLNYQPLVFLTYAIEYHFFELNPKVFHTTNVLFHLLNVLLVFKFIRLISGKNNVAIVAAIIFAIHPMRVESVTWVTTRRDVLYAFFYLLSLLQYIKYTRSVINEPGKFPLKLYVFSIVLFMLSCMSKGMAVSLSLTLILIDYLFERKFDRNAILDKIPFFAISLFFGLLAVFATQTDIQKLAAETYNIVERIQFAAYGILFYLYKFILPNNLSAFYPYPGFHAGALSFQYLMYTILTVGILGLVVYSKKHTRKIIFGFGFFLVTVFLVLQIWPTGNTIVADRYTYIPHIGLSYLAGLGYGFLISKKKAESYWYLPGSTLLNVLMSGAIA